MTFLVSRRSRLRRFVNDGLTLAMQGMAVHTCYDLRACCRRRGPVAETNPDHVQSLYTVSQGGVLLRVLVLGRVLAPGARVRNNRVYLLLRNHLADTLVEVTVTFIMRRGKTTQNRPMRLRVRGSRRRDVRPLRLAIAETLDRPSTRAEVNQLDRASACSGPISKGHPCAVRGFVLFCYSKKNAN